jgi:hypothetical protein
MPHTNDPEKQREAIRESKRKHRERNPEVARFEAREEKRRQREKKRRQREEQIGEPAAQTKSNPDTVVSLDTPPGLREVDHLAFQRWNEDATPFEFVERYMREVYEPIRPPSSLEDLVARPGMKWLLRLTAEERAVVWKVVSLGRSATENRFSLTENAILRKLDASHRIDATPADDVELRAWDRDENRLVPRKMWRYRLYRPTPEDYDHEDDPGPPTITQGGHR